MSILKALIPKVFSLGVVTSLLHLSGTEDWELTFPLWGRWGERKTSLKKEGVYH